MANYQETEVTGTVYVRANQIIVANPLEGVKAISYMEEQVINLSDGDQIVRPQGGFQEPFTAENAMEVFPLVNPQTGDPVGASMRYMDVYVALYSLYVYLAKKRDEAIEQAAIETAKKEAEEAAAKEETTVVPE